MMFYCCSWCKKMPSSKSQKKGAKKKWGWRCRSGCLSKKLETVSKVLLQHFSMLRVSLFPPSSNAKTFAKPIACTLLVNCIHTKTFPSDPTIYCGTSIGWFHYIIVHLSTSQFVHEKVSSLRSTQELCHSCTIDILGRPVPFYYNQYFGTQDHLGLPTFDRVLETAS